MKKYIVIGLFFLAGIVASAQVMLPAYQGVISKPINIITSGLLLNLDASNVGSYSGTGANWYDLSGNNRHGFVRGTPRFGTTFNGYLETGANQIANYIQLPESAPQSLTNGFIFSIDWWCTMKDTVQLDTNNLWLILLGQIFSLSVKTQQVLAFIRQH